MSVIMLEDKIYNNVANALYFYLQKGDLWCWPFGKQIKDLSIEDGHALIQKEVSEWRNQNAISYDIRYRENNGQIEPMKFTPGMACPKIQLYKWLECIEYQIETDYTSILMQKAIRELAHLIISDMDQYKSSQWALEA